LELLLPLLWVKELKINKYEYIFLGVSKNTIFYLAGKLKRLSNRRILLLESAKKLPAKQIIDKNSDNPQFNKRVVALSPGSKKFLSKLGVWDHVWRSQDVTCLQVISCNAYHQTLGILIT